MTQKTKPACDGLHYNRTSNILSWIGPTRDAVLRAAQVETHAERAGKLRLAIFAHRKFLAELMGDGGAA